MSIAQRLVNLSDGLSAEGILSAAKGGTGTTTGAGSSTPTISSINYGGDDTATNPAGGQTITLTGTNFASGARVLINQTAVGVVTVVSSTQITFTAPALSAGSYILYVVNLDGSTAIAVPGIQYSGTPAWTTAAGSLGTGYETAPVSTTVSATSDSAVTYSVVSGTLPDGVVINSSGTISGTSPLVGGSTTYTFTVRATDGELQDTDREFSLTINPDVVTWSSANAFAIQQDAASTTTLSASSAAGQTVSYSVDTLPAGLTLSGATVSGTATTAGTTTTTATATAAVTGKTAQQTITWTVSIAADAYWKYTTLLLNAETVTSTFLSDASSNNFSLTAYGDTKPSNLSPYVPIASSVYFNGSSDYLTSSGNAAIATGEFTVEAWIFPTALNASNTVLDNSLWNIGQNGGYTFSINSTGKLVLGGSTGVWNSSSTWITSTNSVVINRWQHVAITRDSSNVIRCFINGVIDPTTTTYSASLNLSTAGGVSTNISRTVADGGTYNYFAGYISNVHAANGTGACKYTTTFTPSVYPIVKTATTVFLACNSRRLVDASTNAFTLTAGGSAAINNFNPFLTNPSYAAYGSAYFDGSGDYISIPTGSAAALGTTGTVEFWYCPITSPATARIINNGISAATCMDVYDANGQIGFSNAGYTTSTVKLNTWTHIACVINAGVLKIYFNGVSQPLAGTTTGFNLTATGDVWVGGINGYSQWTNGYVSNLRFVKGTAVYTADFTPPTSPLTAIANTSLLTCQSNRFLDNSTNAFAVTKAGDTKISSFVPFQPNSSYATYGSTYFDGNGDYVTYTGGSTTTLSADFTFECWVYLNNLSANQPIICIGDGYNLGALFFIDTAGKLRLYANNVQILTGTGTVAANTWNHVAFVRSGTTVTAYLNGVAGGTATSSSQWSGTTTYIGKEIYNTGTGIQLAGYLSDLRLVKGTALYTANFTPTTQPLTSVSGTSLLTCQTNQPHTNQTFLDNSTSALTITRSGNTTQGAFSPYGASWSNYFDGSGDYLTLPSNQSQFSMGAGDFTIEMWVNITSLAGERTLYDTSNAGDTTATGRILIRVTATSGVVQFATGAGYNLTSGGTLVPNTWYHIAITKANNSTRIFVNGTQVNTTYTDNNTYTVGTSNRPIIGINSYDNSSGPMLGYISNLRVVKGTAVYTAAFTPPTAPLTPITGTSLLTCQAPSLVDNSINAFAITKTGDVSVQRFSPFGTVTQTPTTHSVYFDGSGDWLTIPNNTGFAFGSGNFTVEMWVYITGSSGTVANYSNGQSSNSNFAWELYQLNTTTMMFSVFEGATQYASSSASFSLNTWNHIACVRNNNTLTTYINGVAGATTANVTGVTVTEPASSTLKLCSYGNGSNYVTGYVSNVRVVKGTALYTSNFTVPTQPLTAVSGTSLLTCQDAVIRDNSTNSFTLTGAGNATPRRQNPFGWTTSSAQDYTTSVFGGSAYFDGTDDKLTIANYPGLAFGTSDFTIQGWFYTIASATEQVFATNGWSSYAPWLIRIDSGNILRLNMSTSGGGWDVNEASLGTVTPNQWYHVAVTRTSGTLRAFVNGVQQYTATLAGSLYNGSQALNVGGRSDASVPFKGYLSDVQLINGKSLYTANFVPPSAPLQAVQNTTLLLNMDRAAVVDRSGKVVLETVGDAKVSTSVKKYGSGSMSFDGTGDTLKIPANAQFQYTGDYTVEFWVYFNSVSTEVDIVGNYISNVGTDWMILKTANGTFQFYPSSANSYINGPTPVVNTWYHIAGVRSGSSLKLYVNGVSVGTPLTFSGTLGDATKPLYVGSRGGTTNFLNGYIDDLRISRYARYTANFTPPAQALLTK